MDKSIMQYVNHQISSLRFQMSTALGISHDNKRDLYSIYGYPNDLSGTAGFTMMYQRSKRNGIANRITHGVSKSCWRDGVEIYPDKDDESEQILEDEFLALAKRGLFKKMEQADTLNRIGQFSVLFVGVPDGREPEEEVGPATVSNPLDLIYFKAFAYDGIEINDIEKDTKSPRFGLPTFYTVQKVGRANDTAKDTNQTAIRVHWSRIIHMNEAALDSDIEGMGQLEPIFNRIMDLDKATGGASEAYFRNARGKIAYEIDPEFGNSLLKDKEAKQAFDEGAEEFTNGWKDFVAAAGAKIKTIDTPHASPLDTVKTAMWEVSGYTGIPIRILTGEGSGQLAGSEDQLAYNAIIADRQSMICSGWVIRL